MGQASACCPESNRRYRRAWQPFGNHVAMLSHWHCALAWNILKLLVKQLVSNQPGRKTISVIQENATTSECCKQALSSLLDHSYQNENIVSRRRLLVFPPRFFCLTIVSPARAFFHRDACNHKFPFGNYGSYVQSFLVLSWILPAAHLEHMADPKVQLTFAKTFEGTNLFQILPQGGWTQHERQLLELSIDQDGEIMESHWEPIAGCISASAIVKPCVAIDRRLVRDWDKHLLWWESIIVEEKSIFYGMIFLLHTFQPYTVFGFA